MHPDYHDVVRELDGHLARKSPLLTARELGKSEEGRAIPCALLTDPAVSGAQKQRILIIASQHGSEESGRAIALETISWLLTGSPEAQAVLKALEVAIVPCVSPDGSLLNTYRNAKDVDIAHTFYADRTAGTSEGRALEEFAFTFNPEVFVDIHGLAGGSMKERIWYSIPNDFTADRYFLAELTRKIIDAGEAAGYPQGESWVLVSRADAWQGAILIGEKLARQNKTLCFGMEAIEHYYREADWRASGLARLRALLGASLEDAFGLGAPGYPTDFISGTRVVGLAAHGATAQRRRDNRVEVTNFLARNFCVVDRGADGKEKQARITISSKTCEGANPDRFSVILRIKKPCEIQGIAWEGQALGEDPEHGYTRWEDRASVCIRANLLAPLGGPPRDLVVQYRCPYFE